MPNQDRWADDDVLESFRKPDYAELEVRHGMTLTHTGSRTSGTVAAFTQGDQVLLVDEFGGRHVFRAHDGAFTHNGTRVALRTASGPTPSPRRFTASGSVQAPRSRAGVAKASRIWVEGIHDAELIEKIWGDDLRDAGIVVEPQHGIDDLEEGVARFGPGPKRRLGILVDHLVAGSKESRIAAAVQGPSVLFCGHPYVDVWQAVRPCVVGIDAWPVVMRGTPWKEGVIAALGSELDPGPFWGRVLSAVSSYRDVETPLVNAVEQLIDFVIVD